ncbi:MAG: SRPBCC domain-containing protein [Bacteroidetes bacterium]|nr:SRPBCC domain-containing protein [Bacteroidota bacterium]
MKQLITQIEINASAEEIWNILTDFDKYPEWNPMIRELSGNVIPGETIEVILQQPGGSTMKFAPVVKTFVKNKQFSWKGKLFVSGLFDGEHQFILQRQSENKTIFIHREDFSGMLIPLFGQMIETKTRQGFELMNQKLKERAETR